MSFLLIYTLLYGLVCVCVLFPPTEFVASGLTLDGIFSRWLGDPTTNFVGYQIRRAAIKRVFVALIPFGYFAFALYLFNEGFYLPLDLAGAGVAVGWDAMAWLCGLSLAAFVAYCCYVVCRGLIGDWTWSPVVKSIARCARPPEDWQMLAADINAEVARPDNYATDPRNPIRVIVTQSWIVQVTLFGLDVAKQEHAVLSLRDTEEFAVSHHHVLGIQFLNINVDQVDDGNRYRSRVSFVIRIPSSEFESLTRRLRRPIQNADNMRIAKSPLDSFVSTFKEVVAQNPICDYSGEIESCVGCMDSPANVKLARRCLEENVRSVDVEYANGQFLRLSTCVPCQCRPMWCIDCMSKWFIARQDADRPGTWLTSRAPCPTCRSPFCLRDVCYLSSARNNPAVPVDAE